MRCCKLQMPHQPLCTAVRLRWSCIQTDTRSTVAWGYDIERLSNENMRWKGSTNTLICEDQRRGTCTCVWVLLHEPKCKPAGGWRIPSNPPRTSAGCSNCQQEEQRSSLIERVILHLPKSGNSTHSARIFTEVSSAARFGSRGRHFQSGCPRSDFPRILGVIDLQTLGAKRQERYGRRVLEPGSQESKEHGDLVQTFGVTRSTEATTAAIKRIIVAAYLICVYTC